MASNEFNGNPYSSDEEEVFAGFSVEEIAEIQQRRQYQDFDQEIEEMLNFSLAKMRVMKATKVAMKMLLQIRFNDRIHWATLMFKSFLFVMAQLKILAARQRQKIF